MKCPVCKSDRIGENWVDNGVCGPGYYRTLVNNYCMDCGVMLEPNFVKAARAKEAEDERRKS